MAPVGKYFWICSRLDADFVVDVENGDVSHGQKVVLKSNNGEHSQQWCYDYIFNVIRNRKDEQMCLRRDGDKSRVEEFDEGVRDQRWVLEHNDRVRCLNNADVLVVKGGDAEDDTPIVCKSYDGDQRQKFTFRYVEPETFSIRSKLNGKVLDITGGDGDPGTDIVMWEANGGDNQMWYQDRFGHIFSKLNKLTIECADGSLKTAKYDGLDDDREWILCGNTIRNLTSRNECLDISGANEDDGAAVGKAPYDNQVHQQWEIFYQ